MMPLLSPLTRALSNRKKKDARRRAIEKHMLTLEDLEEILFVKISF